MADAARTIFDSLLPPDLPDPVAFEAYAPSNIALAKYWGKRDLALNLPLNSSLSISLADWGSTTEVAPSDDGEDAIWLQGARLPKDSAFAEKAFTFADRFRRDQELPLHIKTTNTIPTAAGLASSASGFAALTRALSGAFQLELTEAQMSHLARFGSGSAARSMWHGFVRWDRGAASDGSDSFGHLLSATWPDFRVAVVPVDTGPKAHGSTHGMVKTVARSPLFKAWPDQAQKDCADIEVAVRANALTELGPLAEANALAMHATMLAARPALVYLKSGTWAVLEKLWEARADGLAAYATMDAGANVKVIFEAPSSDAVAELFPEASIVQPFG